MLKLEEKIHTKVIVDVSRGGWTFRNCLAWEGANELPCERKGLSGDRG